MNKNRRFILSALLMLGLALMLAVPESAWAGGPGSTCFSSRGLPGTRDASSNCQENPDADSVCLHDKIYDVTAPSAGSGLIASFINDMMANIAPLSANISNAVMADSGFTGAVSAALVLYVMFYGVSFAFGLVQLTLFDLMMRAVKIGAVATLLNGTFSTYFRNTFSHFFYDGTTTMITYVSTMVSGGQSLGGRPFDWMDISIIEMTSVKTLIVLTTLLTTGPYGWVIVFLLGISMYTLIKTMIHAVWVYLFAMIMQRLLFGLAPIFLACILFSRTRPLFDGWLNQVVNSCLQPIFLFAFFSFFIQLISVALGQLLGLDACWTEIPIFVGGPDIDHWWRFAPGGIPFSGAWGIGNSPPIDIMLPLSIWLMSDIARRSNVTVVKMAKDIANASTSYEFKGQVFGGGGSGAGGGSAVAGARPAPRVPLNKADTAKAPDARSAKAVRDQHAALVVKRNRGDFK